MGLLKHVKQSMVWRDRGEHARTLDVELVAIAGEELGALDGNRSDGMGRDCQASDKSAGEELHGCVIARVEKASVAVRTRAGGRDAEVIGSEVDKERTAVFKRKHGRNGGGREGGAGKKTEAAARDARIFNMELHFQGRDIIALYRRFHLFHRCRLSHRDKPAAIP